jgi:hypothetical protein
MGDQADSSPLPILAIPRTTRGANSRRHERIPIRKFRMLDSQAIPTPFFLQAKKLRAGFV